MNNRLILAGMALAFVLLSVHGAMAVSTFQNRCFILANGTPCFNGTNGTIILQGFKINVSDVMGTIPSTSNTSYNATYQTGIENLQTANITTNTSITNLQSTVNGLGIVYYPRDTNPDGFYNSSTLPTWAYNASYVTYTVLNGQNNLSLTQIATNIGNWSADAKNYVNLTILNGQNNLSLSQVTTAIQNSTICHSDGTNCPASSGDNASWNQSYANTLYYGIDSNIHAYLNLSTLPTWAYNATYATGITNLQSANITINTSLTNLQNTVAGLQNTCTGSNSTHAKVLNSTDGTCILVSINPGSPASGDGAYNITYEVGISNLSQANITLNLSVTNLQSTVNGLGTVYYPRNTNPNTYYNSSTLPTWAYNASYVTYTVLNGQNNLSLAQIVANIGNWTSDKASYVSLTTLNGQNNLSLAQISTNIGNWSADKTSYVTLTTLNGQNNLSTSDVATALQNTTIARIGSAQCSGTDQVTNVTVNTSGVYVLCSAQGSGGGMTAWVLSNGSATYTVTDQVRINITAGRNVTLEQSGGNLTIHAIDTDTSYNASYVTYTVLNGQNNFSLAQMVANFGNWSSDKTSYVTLTTLNGQNNLSLAQIATNIGNWSSDRATYLQNNSRAVMTNVTTAWLNTTFLRAGSVNFTTSIITEGTNLYYTDARAASAVQNTTIVRNNTVVRFANVTSPTLNTTWLMASNVNFTTSIITEGANLYFTDARAASAVLNDTILRNNTRANFTQATIQNYTNYTGDGNVSYYQNGCRTVANTTGLYFVC